MLTIPVIILVVYVDNFFNTTHNPHRSSRHPKNDVENRSDFMLSGFLSVVLTFHFI